MLPLYREPPYTFRFADDRFIDRFRLGGVAAGRRVEVFRIDPATVGEGYWADLAGPFLVRAGEAFIAVPE